MLSAIAGVSVISRFVFSLATDRFGGRACSRSPCSGRAFDPDPALRERGVDVLSVRRRLRHVLRRRDGGLPDHQPQLFGAKAPLGSIYSFQMVGAGTGMALGGWLGGAMFDASGAYTSAILVAAIIGYLGVPLSLWLPRHEKAAPPPAKAMATA